MLDEIIDDCIQRNPRSHVGTDNIEIIPHIKQEGKLDDPHYAMFVMAPETLTL